MSRKVSAKYALTPEELDFCLKFKAGLPAATAYRRAFYADLKDGDPELPDSKARSARSQTLLREDYIQRYLAEIEGVTAGDSARAMLADAAQFEGDRVAAQKILEQEDKLFLQDAYERWVEIMCAIGTEVVVPIPGGGEAVVPMREMFPRYAEALPPPAVIEKTMKTLDQYLWKVEHPKPEEYDPKQWSFLDGLNRKYPAKKDPT
jgi:hypothetical protein